MGIKLKNLQEFKQKALLWANQFNICCVLDSNNYTDPYSHFDLIIAADSINILECKNIDNSFQKLEDFRQKNKSWIFGGLAYDLKNEIEKLDSSNPDYINFPDLFFFAPQHILKVKGNELEIISPEAEKIWEAIYKTIISEPIPHPKSEIKARFSKSDYLKTLQQVKNEIAIGNIYETNFCMEFYAEEAEIDPLTTYQHLNQVSPTPFSNYFKWFDKYIISATPERFLSKRGNKLISQPIKGTAKRSANPIEDEQIKSDLIKHPKEQQENIMIVDLVRNDLTKSAKKGTVRVEELFGIYSFKQVPQMISTV
ncbi:MAG: chorismate-binding protein, partial [Bacteroidetes bacterium]|nr:chorismate-binding protein [Bacteroidota bacterium]